MAGGFGSRLGALTELTPKPLLPIAGRPFLDYLLDQLLPHRISHLILLAGYHGDQMRDWARSRTDRLRIDCMVEAEPAGTAGGLHAARNLLSPHFLCMNGDSLFRINLGALAELQSQEPWLALMALRKVEDIAKYGEVTLQGNVVSGFLEKGGRTGPGLINGGVYIFRREILDVVPSPPASLERDVFPQIASQGQVRGRVFDDYFVDIGTPDDYARAQNDLRL
jgi:D-glycero-D-manno-heptose 1,7-bisphosphate phosphatase